MTYETFMQLHVSSVNINTSGESSQHDSKLEYMSLMSNPHVRFLVPIFPSHTPPVSSTVTALNIYKWGYSEKTSWLYLIIIPPLNSCFSGHNCSSEQTETDRDCRRFNQTLYDCIEPVKHIADKRGREWMAFQVTGFSETWMTGVP